MQSYVAGSCVYVQVDDVSRFRSFDAAYEGIVLRVYVKALYIATYIHNCWVSPFSARIRAEFLPRFLPRKIVRKITAKSCRKSECVRVDICVCLHRKIQEFIGKMLSVSSTVFTLEVG